MSDIDVADTYGKPGDPGDDAFQKWKARYAPNDSGEDYDLRGAFLAGMTPDAKTGHWPDTFKKPNHPTFSRESIYAKDRPDLAGVWDGETYLPAGGNAFPAGAPNPYQGKFGAGKQNPTNQEYLVTDEATYDAVPFGKEYTDPEGNKRTKRRSISGGSSAEQAEAYDAIGEGETYYDPEGQERVKPVSKPLSYSAQTLYSMAVTPKEKRKILEKFYPGKVVEDGTELAVMEDDGTILRPGGFRKSPVSALAMTVGNAAPMAGGAIGGILGAPAGPATSAGGAALGTMGGQYFNDIILNLSGVYDRTPGENFTDKAIGAGTSLAGDAVGRGIAAAVPSVKHGVSKLTNAAPDLANKFLGTNADDLTRARRIAEIGEKPNESPVLNSLGITGTDTGVGVSTFAHESPHLQNVHEVFRPAFDTSQPLQRSAERAYQEMASPLLEKQGVQSIDDLVAPPVAVSTQETGEKLIARALEESGQIDAKMAAQLAERRAAMEAGAGDNTAQREVILRTAKEQHNNASQLIKGAISDIERNADNAVNAAAGNTNSGGLWQRVGEQIRATRTAIGERYRNNARQAYEAAPPGARIDASPLATEAEDFILNVPPEFASRNPTLVRQIQRLGQREVPEDAVAGATPPAPMLTLEELHNIRSTLRSAADWYDLPSDFKNGSLKYFSHQVDNLIQQAGAQGSPLETSVRLLNENDRWFAQERPIFNAAEMKAVIRGLEAGEPADPELLFKTLVKPNHTDMIARAEQVVGPNLWNGVRGAQVQRWAQNARSGQFDGSVDPVKFASEILGAHNDGTLVAVQGRERAAQLLQQAQQIAALNGKLPIDYRPGDTAFDIFRKAHAAMQTAEKEAATDPLKVLARDVRKMEGEARQARNEAKRNDPLRFLQDKSFGATRAVDKILGDEDLILAAANRFGEQSPEFNALRAVWTERVFKGTLEPGKKLAKVSPEVQRLMLGTNLETAQKIAEDMTFIMSSKSMQRGDTAAGMSAMAKVEHPIAGKAVSRMARVVPGANTAARATLGAYYTFMARALESPAFLRWLEKSYAAGPEKRAAIRADLARIMQRGGAIGAGAAQGAYQFGNE